MKYVTLRNQNHKPWVCVPVLHEEAGLAITPCVDHTLGKAPKRNRYLVTHLKSGKKLAGGPTGVSKRRALHALKRFLALPVDWRMPPSKVLLATKPHMPTIMDIREEARR